MIKITTRLASIFKINSNRKICTSSSISGHWNKDWLPLPYPKTIKERNAAAKKYNLHPHEYTPYPDNGFGFGDYPKLPFQGVALRDPHYPYDIPEHRRNFNEPVHVDIDLLGEDRCDIGVIERYSTKFMIVTFILVFSGLIASCYISRYFPVFQPVTEKQYPWKGKTYYTFEKIK